MTRSTPPSLDIAEAFRAGRRGFVANIVPLLAVALVVWVVNGAVNLWGNQTAGVAQFFWSVVSFFLGQIVAVAWIALALAIIDGREFATDVLLPSGSRPHVALAPPPS